MEFFAGDANVSAALKLAGFPGISVDCRYAANFDILTNSGFALSVIALMKVKTSGLAVLAPVCASFSSMSRYQSKRSPRTPLGDDTRLWVKEANVMAARVVLLLWLAQALQIPYIVEQPGGSLLSAFPRFVSFQHDISVLFKVGVWMRLFGHTSMKRTVFWSNTHSILDLAMAKLCRKDCH